MSAIALTLNKLSAVIVTSKKEKVFKLKQI